MIIALILLGRMLEARARGQASEAIRRLMDLQPPTARLLRDGVEIEVPVEEVRTGDLVVVRPGERIPVDGERDRRRIGGGRIDADRREPAGGEGRGRGGVRRAPSTARAACGTRPPRWGAERVLQQMVEMVKQAQGSRAPVARLADVVSGYFTAGRAGGGPSHVRGMAVLRAVRYRHGERGGGADHRLPVRAGAGHPDRHHGGDRARRRARHPDQGRRGAGDGASHQRDRAGQNGDDHARQAARDADCAGGRVRRGRSAAAGGKRGAILGASAGPGDCRGSRTARHRARRDYRVLGASGTGRAGAHRRPRGGSGAARRDGHGGWRRRRVDRDRRHHQAGGARRGRAACGEWGSRCG